MRTQKYYLALPLSEKSLFKIHIDQVTHEKMLNIISHWGKANQNHNGLPMHPQYDGYNQKDR